MSQKHPSVVSLVESLYGAANPKDCEHEQLVSLMFDAQFSLLFAFLDFVPMDRGDSIALLICKLGLSRSVFVATVTALVVREVQMCTSNSTLFRNNSMASRIIGHAARAIGKSYFRVVLQEVLLPIITAEPGTYEVDPDKVLPGADVVQNVAALSDVCDALLQSIFKHVQACPLPIRRLCAIMHDSVQEKFPQHGSIAIGSFFFLRFINPALSLPEQYELVPSVTPDVRRSMILITKVLQQLANEVDTFKEQYMAPFAPFVLKHKERLHRFYREICSCQDIVGFQPNVEAEFSSCSDLNANMKFTTLDERKTLYKLFYDKKHQISERLNPSLAVVLCLSLTDQVLEKCSRI
jgi:neurofibromin 1